MVEDRTMEEPMTERPRTTESTAGAVAGAGWPPGSSSHPAELGGAVRITEYGGPTDTAPAVCLHGLGGSALNFGLVAPLLATERRVVVPDLLGHGGSGAPEPRDGSVEAQLRMIGQLLDRVIGRPVVLVGHSMGGVLAMLHAVRAPDTVERLVLIDPPVPNVTRWRRDPRLTAKLALLRCPGVSALVARQVTGMSPEQLVQRQLTEATPYVDHIPAVAVDATVAETRNSRGHDGGRAAQRAQFQAIVDVVALLARPPAWRDQVAKIAAPTLWLQGEDDPLATTPAARVLAATRPEWTFLTRPGVGHLPHLEDPAWTTASIKAWLGEPL
jgi:pimeloyl-ACP methyl ester carboxylesterase